MNATKAKYYDAETVRQAADGQWKNILISIGGFPADSLDDHHHSCPICNQGKDCFRFISEDDGAVLCNRCFSEKNGDGFAAIMKMTGKPFLNVLADVAEFVGVQPSANGRGRKGKKRKDPFKGVKWPDERVAKTLDYQIDQWCEKKPPITRTDVDAFGGKRCYWRDFPCIAFPGTDIDGKGKAVLLYRVNGEVFSEGGGLSKRKTHLVGGSVESWLWPGTVDDLKQAEVYVKCEGLADAMALWSAGLPDGWIVITNACGAKSANSEKLDFSFAKGKKIVGLGDADKPGQEGIRRFAVAFHRAGAAEIRNVQLYDEVADDHGKDLRDWLKERHTFQDLQQLADEAEPVTEEQVAEWKAEQKRETSKPRVTLENIDDPHETDLVNAKRFNALHGHNLRYCHPWKKWMWFSGKRWETDRTGEVQRAGKDTVAKLWHEALEEGDSRERDRLLSFAKKSESAAAIENMIRLSQTEGKIPVVPEQFNTHIWSLNCENGTLDLKTGELREHRQEDYLTQLAPVVFDPSATSPRWEQFLDEVFLNNELIQFVQRLFGYCLTGSTRDHVFPVLHGRGSNGKSTMVEIFFSVLGPDYSMKGTHDFLMVKQGSHPTEKADLFGRRFVGCVETEDGKRLAESRVKEFTGGDRIRARRMREDYWEFPATHKVWLATNHKPRIKGTDEGIWRRVCLIPFEASFEGGAKDTSLPEKLEAELPGILNWALAGCLGWQRVGLNPPKVVQVATSAYRQDEDLIAQFVEECCELDSDGGVGATDLYRSFRDWSGTKMSQTAFGKLLTERGFDKATPHGRVMYIGISLRKEFWPQEK